MRDRRKPARGEEPTMDETFPDLGSLTDVELKDVIRQLTEEETEISYRRRILHGKIDILRAELVNRLRKKHDGGEVLITGDDVQQLTDILAQRQPESEPGRRGVSVGGPHCASPAGARAVAGSGRAHGPALHRVRLRQRRGSQLLPALRRAARARRGGAASRSRRPTASTTTGELVPVEIERGHRARPGARDPRRRRPRGRELRRRPRAHEHRPAPGLRGVPRRRHRLARPRAADPPRRRSGTSTTWAR